MSDYKFEYAVKAETHKGDVIIVARGFTSRVEAEDWKIRLADYRRVWVDPVAALSEVATGRFNGRNPPQANLPKKGYGPAISLKRFG